MVLVVEIISSQTYRCKHVGMLVSNAPLTHFSFVTFRTTCDRLRQSVSRWATGDPAVFQWDSRVGPVGAMGYCLFTRETMARKDMYP